MGQQVAELPPFAVAVLFGLLRRPRPGNDDIPQHTGVQLRVPFRFQSLFTVPGGFAGSVAHRGKAEHVCGPVYAPLLPVDLVNALIPGQQHVYRAGQLHALRRQTTVRHQRKGRVRSGSTFPLPFNPHTDPVPPKTAVPCRLLLLPPGRTSPTLPVLPFPPVPLQLRSPARRAPRSPR